MKTMHFLRISGTPFGFDATHPVREHDAIISSVRYEFYMGRYLTSLLVSTGWMRIVQISEVYPIAVNV